MSDPRGERVPRPNLTYTAPRDREWTGAGIIGDGPRLANVHDVSVHGQDGDVWVRGRMLCKDGHRGPNRCVRVYCDVAQPVWLSEVIEDALRRLVASDRTVRPPNP